MKKIVHQRNHKNSIVSLQKKMKLEINVYLKYFLNKLKNKNFKVKRVSRVFIVKPIFFLIFWKNFSLVT